MQAPERDQSRSPTALALKRATARSPAAPLTDFSSRRKVARSGWSGPPRKEMMLVNRRIYRPGETVPTSGQYSVVDASGRSCGREITSVRGEPFPPTRTAREFGYVLVDATVHR